MSSCVRRSAVVTLLLAPTVCWSVSERDECCCCLWRRGGGSRSGAFSEEESRTGEVASEAGCE